MKFIEEWKAKKKLENENSSGDFAEKVVLRDHKAKLITFELISIRKFGISQNFSMPEDMV